MAESLRAERSHVSAKTKFAGVKWARRISDGQREMEPSNGAKVPETEKCMPL